MNATARSRHPKAARCCRSSLTDDDSARLMASVARQLTPSAIPAVPQRALWCSLSRPSRVAAPVKRSRRPHHNPRARPSNPHRPRRDAPPCPCLPAVSSPEAYRTPAALAHCTVRARQASDNPLYPFFERREMGSPSGARIGEVGVPCPSGARLAARRSRWRTESTFSIAIRRRQERALTSDRAHPPLHGPSGPPRAGRAGSSSQLCGRDQYFSEEISESRALRKRRPSQKKWAGENSPAQAKGAARSVRT
jgi:hypothetical protein